LSLHGFSLLYGRFCIKNGVLTKLIILDMKSGIHPEVYDVVFTDASTGAEFISTSTYKTKETKTIDGKDYFVIKVDVTSDSHPFYTGKQSLIDTAGRVEKFQAKMAKAEALKEEADKK
jgi:large subunit ribosomal protein L31